MLRFTLFFACLLANAQTPLTLAELERMALAASPSLQQSAQQVRASVGRERQAGLYPNPVLGSSGEHVTPRLNGGAIGGYIEQRIVTGGKLGLARKAAEQTRIASEQMQETERLRVLTQIRTLYYQALGEQRLIEVRQNLAAVAARTAATWRERANLGQLDAPDVMAAEVDQQRMELSVTLARNALQRTWLEISSSTGQALAEEKLQGDLENLPKIDQTAALAKIYAESPDLRMAEANLKGAEFSANRARAERIPDIILRGGVRANRETAFDGMPVGPEGIFDTAVEIPLFNRNQGGIAAARADAERARLEGARLKQQLAQRLAMVYREYRDAADTVARLRDPIIPQARKAYEMYLGNFQQMAAPHQQVLLTQRTLAELEEQYINALMAAWRSATEIDGLLTSEMY